MHLRPVWPDLAEEHRLIFGAAALLIGLWVRKPFMGLNHFMEEKLEETEML